MKKIPDCLIPVNKSKATSDYAACDSPPSGNLFPTTSLSALSPRRIMVQDVLRNIKNINKDMVNKDSKKLELSMVEPTEKDRTGNYILCFGAYRHPFIISGEKGLDPCKYTTYKEYKNESCYAVLKRGNDGNFYICYYKEKFSK